MCIFNYNGSATGFLFLGMSKMNIKVLATVCSYECGLQFFWLVDSIKCYTQDEQKKHENIQIHRLELF